MWVVSCEEREELGAWRGLTRISKWWWAEIGTLTATTMLSDLRQCPPRRLVTLRND